MAILLSRRKRLSVLQRQHHQWVRGENLWNEREAGTSRNHEPLYTHVGAPHVINLITSKFRSGEQNRHELTCKQHGCKGLSSRSISCQSWFSYVPFLSGLEMLPAALAHTYQGKREKKWFYSSVVLVSDNGHASLTNGRNTHEETYRFNELAQVERVYDSIFRDGG